MQIGRSSVWLSLVIAVAAAVGIILVSQEHSDVQAGPMLKAHDGAASQPDEAPPGNERATSSGRDEMPMPGAARVPVEDVASRPLYFAEVKAAAMSGDPRAQRELSTIYGDCMAYSLSPQAYISTLDNFAARNPGSAESISSIKERRSQICSTVDEGQVIPFEAYSLWMNAAAESGDVVSQIRRQVRSLERLSSEEYASYADAAIESGDPRALFELGDLLVRAPQDKGAGRYTDVSGTPYAGYAWGIVACKAGLPCGPGTPVMDSLCVNTGACGYSSYEGFVFSELIPPADRHKMDALIQEVERLVNEGSR